MTIRPSATSPNVEGQHEFDVRRRVALEIETCRTTAALLDVVVLLAARSVAIDRLTAVPSSPATVAIRCDIRVAAERTGTLVARLQGLPRVLAARVVEG